MRRVIVVLGVGSVLLSACGGGAVDQSTVPPETAAVTTSAPTTTTVAATTTTVAPTTTTTLLTVEGIPPEALALIGAPMPEVDLTMDSVDDIERWFREYLKWSTWLSANPTSDPTILSYALQEQSTIFLSTQESMDAVIEAELFVVSAADVPVEIQSIDASPDFFDSGGTSAVLVARQSADTWVLTVGDLTVSEFLEVDPLAQFTSTFLVVSRGSDGVWRLSSWD